MTSFYDLLAQWPAEKRKAVWENTDFSQVQRALSKDNLTPQDFLALLSPCASEHLELIAQRAHELTLRFFGHAVNLFTPLYISDVCTNQCRYCGFNAHNTQKRTHLSPEAAAAEARLLHDQGHRHLLLLTGDAP